MNKNIRDMSYEEIMDSPMLGLDDSFPFRCKSCGKCCKHREDILLTPYDVYRLARYLERKPEEIIEGYCEVYEGHSSHLPVVRIVPRPPENSCPFLRNKKCAVHAGKPVLCRVFPLARISRGMGKAEFYYGEGPKCGHGMGITTVRNWIADVAFDESERAGVIWTVALQRIIPTINENRKARSSEDNSRILDAFFSTMYLPYDTAKDFAAQCQENTDALCDLLLNQYGIKVPSLDEIMKIMEENKQ